MAVRSPGYGIPCFREPLATKAGLPTRMLEQMQGAGGSERRKPEMYASIWKLIYAYCCD
jgi:hypothetical protein